MRDQAGVGRADPETPDLEPVTADELAAGVAIGTVAVLAVLLLLAVIRIAGSQGNDFADAIWVTVILTPFALGGALVGVVVLFVPVHLLTRRLGTAGLGFLFASGVLGALLLSMVLPPSVPPLSEGSAVLLGGAAALGFWLGVRRDEPPVT